MLSPTPTLNVTTADGLEAGDVIVDADGERKVLQVNEPREGMVYFRFQRAYAARSYGEHAPVEREYHVRAGR